MGDDIAVRPATADDLAALRGVARRAWEAAYADTFDPATIDELLERGYADEVLEELVDADNAALLVAVDEDVIGYAGAVEADEEPAADLNVYVDPDRWGQGVGAQLLEATRERLADSGVERVSDYVLAENEVGNAFYAAHFDRVDERQVEIDGETHDANVYEAPLG
ncbi:GNAT family N-acetyltransferase [Natronoarchaeum mannanilyticum]|uniref:N-acetyltransferase domain-containing protein n=1 Tax=Natronoarchaeum mannanilyticum TaxID=926360 RepID=A0AAV3T5R3_9EURY